MPSLYETANHVLAPVLGSALVAPAVVWGAAAVVLPWLTRSRSLALQLVLVTIWAAMLASTTTAVLAVAHAGASVKPHAAVVGAIAGGLAALMPAVVGRWGPHRQPADPAARLA
jgi:hypothetical protein